MDVHLNKVKYYSYILLVLLVLQVLVFEMNKEMAYLLYLTIKDPRSDVALLRIIEEFPLMLCFLFLINSMTIYFFVRLIRKRSAE